MAARFPSPQAPRGQRTYPVPGPNAKDTPDQKPTFFPAAWFEQRSAKDVIPPWAPAWLAELGVNWNPGFEGEVPTGSRGGGMDRQRMARIREHLYQAHMPGGNLYNGWADNTGVVNPGGGTMGGQDAWEAGGAQFPVASPQGSFGVAGTLPTGQEYYNQPVSAPYYSYPVYQGPQNAGTLVGYLPSLNGVNPYPFMGTGYYTGQASYG